MNRIDEIRLLLEKFKCEILQIDGIYICYQDEFGYKYKKYVYNKNFENGIYSHKFDKKNKYCIDNINLKLLKDNNFNTKIIPESYNGSKEKSIFICGNCGQTFSDLLWNVFNYKYKVCPNCIHKIQNTKLANFDDIKNEVESYGYNLLDSKWTGNHTRIDVMDKDGYKGRVKLESLRSGGRFYMFHPSNPYSLDNLKLYCKLNGLECMILNQKYVSSDKIKTKCECGNVFYTSITRLLHEKEFRCPECTRKQSTLEIRVKEWLIKNDIKFIEQHTYPDCRYKHPLRFDFYLPEYNICIECQGKQHYKPVEYFGGEKGFQKQQKRDEIKRKYCESHNIELIEIPYYEFNDNNDFIKYFKKIIK